MLTLLILVSLYLFYRIYRFLREAYIEFQQQELEKKLTEDNAFTHLKTEEDSYGIDFDDYKATLKVEPKKHLAADRTKEAQKALSNIENNLKQALKKESIFEWELLLGKSEYPKATPKKPNSVQMTLEEARKNSIRYIPRMNFIQRIVPSLNKEQRDKAEELYKKDRLAWEKEEKFVEEQNKKLIETYEEDLKKWEIEKNEYHKKREEKILEQKEKRLNKELTAAFIDYCEMVLSKSQYPDTFPQQFDIDYNPENKILIVDYFLPSIENLPTLTEVKFVVSQDEFKEKHLSETARNKMYDDLLYQITLRTIYELYKSDSIKLIEAIVFNGCVKFIDKGTGKEVTSCILSIQTKRDEFVSINLENVDPKICFKNLKGIGSSKLHGLAPVAPILKIDREDKRFITPYGVVGSVDETTNIAAMDWKDFENLIREIFEKEFSSVGGEVKITQASRDRGVDAIAFDPDPIRGGKIVIQAKRYTNIVGVPAVRDLYGTVINEGATKGILITTTDYGPDAYHFAKDKPITLLNGSNLLHLLEKHGHKAKIDINEAKKILGETNQGTK